MEKYIQQLIEDLERVAKNPQNLSYIELPLHLSDDTVTMELALVPFKTIEELTGIKQEAFPEIIHLPGDQWQSENWFHFKMKRLGDHVTQIIYSEIHKMSENYKDNELPFWLKLLFNINYSKQI